MERADLPGETPPADRARQTIALGFALILHGLLFTILSFVPEKPIAEPKAPISVQLVVLENLPSPEPVAAKDIPAEPTPDPTPTQRPEPPVASPELTVPPPDQSTDLSEPEALSDPIPTAPPASVPLSILSTEDEQVGEPIPDRWRLPPGASIPLDKTQQSSGSAMQAFARSLDCLGFDADCAEQRKVVFSEEQLSGTDLVWMPSFAHSGLSDADLYGLSESEIRKRLGITVAGENGFGIIPGILTIDGPWWDALHGVNKACEYGISGGSQALGEADSGGSGRVLVKRCDPGRASSKDRIGFIPKPDE